MDRWSLSLLLCAAIVVALVFIVFAPVVGADFVLDDRTVLDQQLPYFGNLLDAFRPAAATPELSRHYYRPLVIVSYLVDETLAASFWPEAGRDHARRIVFHATCVAWHALASALLFALAWAVAREAGFGDPPRTLAATAAAALFAVHPVHVESVAWLAGRSDVMCAAFALTALLCALEHRRSAHPAWLAALGGAALGAMLCKEEGVVVVAVAPLLDVFAPAAGAGADQRFRRAAAGAGAALIYIVLRLMWLPAAPAAPTESSGAGPAALPAAVGWYALRLFYARGGPVFLEHWPRGPFPWIGGVALAGLVVFAAAALLGRRSRQTQILCWSCVFGALALAPALALLFLHISDTPVAERYLYLPSAGFALTVGLVLAAVMGRAGKRWGDPAAGGVALGAIAGLCSVSMSATAARLPYWGDPLSFWRAAVERAPDHPGARLQLGVALGDRGRFEEAIAQFEKVGALDAPAAMRARADNNRGLALLSLRRTAEAMAAFDAALAIDPANGPARFNGALAARLAADAAADGAPGEALLARAEAGFAAVLRDDPGNPRAHYQLALLLAGRGRAEDARGHLERVVALAPASAEGRLAREMLRRLK